MLYIYNFFMQVLRSETEPLVLQFIYVSHDHDMRYIYCGIVIVLYITFMFYFYCKCYTMIGILFLYHVPCSTTFVVFVQDLLCIIFVLFSRCAINIILSKGCCFMYILLHARTHTHTNTHTYTHAHTNTTDIYIHSFGVAFTVVGCKCPM